MTGAKCWGSKMTDSGENKTPPHGQGPISQKDPFNELKQSGGGDGLVKVARPASDDSVAM